MTEQLVAIEQVIDLDRYPLGDLESERGRELVASCREALRATGACHLDGFVRPEAVTQILAEAERLAPEAFATDKRHNVYFREDDASLPADDPRRITVRSAKRAIAWDQIPPDSPLRSLYTWGGLTELVRVALEMEVLYQSADPLDCCEIAIMEPGEELGWHFDNSPFSVTLMLQPAETGGVFEYVPRLRSAEDENYGGVQRLLQGSRDGIIVLPQAPGTLSLFRGTYSVHRVTPIQGAQPRINAVLTYADRPGMKLSELTQRLFYGRTA